MYNYFPHPSSFRTMDAVLSMRIEEGAAGYGVYMMLLELLRDAEGCILMVNPRHLAFAINEPDTALVERVITKYSLFEFTDKGQFASPWLNAAMQQYQAVKDAAAEAGRRGAAKRWGTKQENSTPNSPLMEGGMATLSHPDSNINNNTNQEDKPTNSRSKLLAMTWNDWTGEQLYKLAIKDTERIDQTIIEGYASISDAQHNAEGLAIVCQEMRVGTETLKFLWHYTEGAKIGSQGLIRVLALGRKIKKDKFAPRFPNEYVLCKILSNESFD